MYSYLFNKKQTPLHQPINAQTETPSFIYMYIYFQGVLFVTYLPRFLQNSMHAGIKTQYQNNTWKAALLQLFGHSLPFNKLSTIITVTHKINYRRTSTGFSLQLSRIYLLTKLEISVRKKKKKTKILVNDSLFCIVCVYKSIICIPYQKLCFVLYGLHTPHTNIV